MSEITQAVEKPGKEDGSRPQKPHSGVPHSLPPIGRILAEEDYANDEEKEDS